MTNALAGLVHTRSLKSTVSMEVTAQRSKKQQQQQPPDAQRRREPSSSVHAVRRTKNGREYVVTKRVTTHQQSYGSLRVSGGQGKERRGSRREQRGVGNRGAQREVAYAQGRRMHPIMPEEEL